MLKHFLLKLIKKNDRVFIEELIPEKDRKIVNNAVKTENREKRKKRDLSNKRREEYNRKKHEAEDIDSESQSVADQEPYRETMEMEAEGEQVEGKL